MQVGLLERAEKQSALRGAELQCHYLMTAVVDSLLWRNTVCWCCSEHGRCCTPCALCASAAT